MIHKLAKILAYTAAVFILLQVTALYSKDLSFTLVDIQKLNTYDQNRVLYQQIESPHNEYAGDVMDNSIADLMIIKDKQVYLFKDGYDSQEEVQLNKVQHDKGNQFLPDMYPNKISSNPNFVLITDRRIEVQKNTSKDFVSSNYRDFYLSVRDKFLKKHVSIFLALIVNRKDTEISVERTRIARKLADGEQAKFMTTVSARTPDGGTVYYAEDRDGDGITETLTVNSSDGFHWGYKSGPNLIYIIRNSQKDVEKIIGSIAKIAYYGSPEEEQIIKKNFPSVDKINSMINDTYIIDAETNNFLKKNNINLEENVDKASKTETK